MALFSTGNGAKYWRTPSRGMPDGVSGPLWMVCWAKGPALGTTGQILCGFDRIGSTVATRFVYGFNDSTNNIGHLSRNNANTLSQSLGSAQWPVNQWNHIYAYEANASSRGVFINGVAGPVDTGTVAGPQTLDAFAILGSASSPTFNGATTYSVAEVAYGWGILSTAQLAAMVAGQNPLTVAGAQLAAYFPLRGSLDDMGPRRIGLVPTGSPATVWGEHPPVSLPPRRRLLKVSSGATSVFFTGLSRFQAGGRIAPAPLGAPLLGRTAAQAAARAVESQGTRIIGLTEAMAAARAPMSPSTPVTGKSEATGAAKATSTLAAPLTGRTEAAGAGKASPGLATTVAGVTRAAARGGASSSVGAILSALARTSGAAAGRAAPSLATAIVGRSQAKVVAAAVLSSGTSLSGKTQAGAQGRASSTSGAILVGIARTGGAAMGRAAASVVTTIAGRSQAKAAAQLTPSAGTVLTGKSRAVAQLRASSSSGAVLVGVARTGGAASGRARVSLTSSLTGATTSSARGRAGLGVSLTAVGRTFARLTARLFAGARPPSVFDIGHGVTIPTDTRLASVQADSRAVTLSGSV